MAPGLDSDPELEQQRTDIETSFRQGWRPVGAGQSRVLTEHAYARARAILGRGGWTEFDQATVEAVRGGARPGDQQRQRTASVRIGRAHQLVTRQKSPY
ncbi:MAG: hypothetical protein J2P26_06480 [Nocardiopsaceae bacterium]|nr:hypothetical protein [Nocardiopsaceae bacterium]